MLSIEFHYIRCLRRFLSVSPKSVGTEYAAVVLHVSVAQHYCKVVLTTLCTELMRIQDGRYTTSPELPTPYRSFTA